jgi:hypothetical protein
MRVVEVPLINLRQILGQDKIIEYLGRGEAQLLSIVWYVLYRALKNTPIFQKCYAGLIRFSKCLCQRLHRQKKQLEVVETYHRGLKKRYRGHGRSRKNQLERGVRAFLGNKVLPSAREGLLQGC